MSILNFERLKSLKVWVKREESEVINRINTSVEFCYQQKIEGSQRMAAEPLNTAFPEMGHLF